MATCACGDEIKPPESSLVVNGGWCMPSEAFYDLPKPEPMCTDCRVRMLMIMEIGIDPGRKGENLRVPRGGINYTRKEN